MRYNLSLVLTYIAGYSRQYQGVMMSNLDENKTGNLAGSDISSKNKQDTYPEKATQPFYKEPMVLAAMGLI